MEQKIGHAALARVIAGECMVLLENDGTLPLRTVGKLALYGSGARRTVRGGTGSGDVNVRSSVSVEQGLENAGFQITTKDWLDRQDAAFEASERDHGRRIRALAKEKKISEQHAGFTHPFSMPAPQAITEDDIIHSETDTAVYVLSRISGEGADRRCRRGDYLLYEEEAEQLRRLGSAYARLILVLNTGGVIDLSEVKAIPGIRAVLLMAQLGNTGGDALADVLTGKVTPSGKLTDTWAARYEDYPASAAFGNNDGNTDEEYYAEGIYVGYRFFDAFRVRPLYPFGYGKSYTSFAINAGGVTQEGEAVRLSVSVKNTGRAAGKEVVQVYVSAPVGAIDRPYQELLCFQKTKLLLPGESETMELSFPIRSLAAYCEKRAAWVMEAGSYLLRVGNSSVSTVPAAALVLDDTVVTEELKHLFADADPVKEIRPPARADEPADASVPRISLREDAICTEQAVYQEVRTEFVTEHTERLTAEDIREGRCTAEDMAAQLTVEELAELCVGASRMDGGDAVGNASAAVPGAAGDTSAVIADSRGIRSLTLADGPAGLRLDLAARAEQDCTQLPTGWALAQSWNMPLLEEAGFMIGTEMERFGVDLWLAPALNIHRDPLCGRNFEYYSEDPLISGKAAAAVTRGVQRRRGKGATIKHFAANSQEDNRYFTNSHISERALREIYLRGFEIAVRESQPAAVMTSYNLLNGIHTANHRDLLQAVLRDEWGFEGVVMSDWFTSQDQTEMTGSIRTDYPISASSGCVYAGNDIQMPGCRKNVDDLIRAVREETEIDGYRVTLADLQQSAAAVIRAVMKMSDI